MFRSSASVLASLTLAAVAFAAPAAGEPEVSTPTLAQIPDSPKDFRLSKDRRKNKDAVSAAKASDITNATFTITGSAPDAILEARISVARMLGKKHTYNQAVGLWGNNFYYYVRSSGDVTFHGFQRKHPSCDQVAHRRDRRAGTLTITMPMTCAAFGLPTTVLDARAFIQPGRNGVSAGGDSTRQVIVDLTTQTFTSIQDMPNY